MTRLTWDSQPCGVVVSARAGEPTVGGIPHGQQPGRGGRRRRGPRGTSGRAPRRISPEPELGSGTAATCWPPSRITPLGVVFPCLSVFVYFDG